MRAGFIFFWKEGALVTAPAFSHSEIFRSSPKPSGYRSQYRSHAANPTALNLNALLTVPLPPRTVTAEILPKDGRKEVPSLALLGTAERSSVFPGGTALRHPSLLFSFPNLL